MMTIMVRLQSLLITARGGLERVTHGFQSLQGSPDELYKAYILKFLDSYSYFSFSLIFTLFLSEDFGYSDVEAGTLYGAWGALVTIYGLVTGYLIDNWGVARSLQVGFLLTLVSRIVIFLTSSRTVLVLMVCGALPFGGCLGIPVLTVGIRRYTNETNRGFAFGLFYVVMNVAALLSGPIVDACTIPFKSRTDEGERHLGDEPDVSEYPWKLSGYRLVVVSGIISNVIAVVVTWTVREIKIESSSADMTTMNNNIDNPDSTSLQNQGPVQKVAAFTPLKGSAWAIVKEIMESRRFWRFLVVCLITLNVRMIFRHLDATFPKYMLREFGDNVPKGTIYSINPALIIILVPIVTAATSGVDPLLMIHHGSYISAASVFFLALSTSIWSSILFVIMLSIGEAIWSPRLYDYTMSVAKEGREGTYGALSSAPLFLAKLPVGFMSGYLLKEYCPEEGERRSKMMWFIIGASTVSSPILMSIFWKYISYKDPDEGVKYTELLNQESHSESTTTSYQDDVVTENESSR